MKINTIASLVFILIAMSWGCSQDAGKEAENNSPEVTKQKESVPTPAKKISPAVEAATTTGADASGLPDTYGRKPGEEHYGHSHGLENDKPTVQPSTGQGSPIIPGAPAAGGPDKYGRQPGEEHYGHDHE